MPGAPAAEHHFEVRLLGRTSVHRDGEELPPLPPQMLTVLTLLVLNGHQLHRDTLIERLWPDIQVRDGRARLRPLLSHCRRQLGLNLSTHGEAVVMYDTSWCDVDDFIRSATLAISGIHGRLQSHALGIYAQSLWAGPPLEAYRYDKGAIRVRELCFKLQLRLWDMLEAVELRSDWPPEMDPPRTLVSRPASVQRPTSLLDATDIFRRGDALPDYGGSQ